MRHLFYIIPAAAMLAVIYNANQNVSYAKPQVQQASMQFLTRPEDPAASVAKADEDFMKEAAAGGMMEVELGKLAQQNGGSQKVKDFGSMMVKDHSNANDALKKLAASKNVSLPTAMDDKTKKEMDMLKSKKGADFDKAYVDMMVEDHKKDVEKFKMESKMAKDEDVKAFATKTLPTLEKHLNAIQSIQKEMK